MKMYPWLWRLLAVAVLSAGAPDTIAAQDADQQPAPSPTAASAPASPQDRPDPNAGSIRVLVLDQSGAAIVGANVSVVPANASSGTQARTTTANEQGEAVINGLAPGKYLIQIDSIGFDTLQIADVNVRRGRQERKDAILAIAGYVEEVEVTRDKADQNITDNFSSALTQDQIDALPDDEDEMADQLAQMAGPGAVGWFGCRRGSRLSVPSSFRTILPRRSWPRSPPGPSPPSPPRPSSSKGSANSPIR